MSNEIIEDLKTFFRSANLSNYEIKAYITLLISNNLTARELSEKSNVPTGRIYEILDVLKDKGMIEIQDSRPKIFRAISFNEASHNTILHIKNSQQRKVTYLINQAKQLESKVSELNFLYKPKSSKIFWSTAFGWRSIFELYTKRFNNLKENLFMTGFINENTIKVLPQAKNFYRGLLNAISRGIQVKYLWSFGFDERPLSDEQKTKIENLFNILTNKLKDLFNLSSGIDGFEMKFIYNNIPSYYDIFDDNRILIKLQNPLLPWQFFACINVLDPLLAKKLTEKYENMWLFEGLKGKK